LTCGGVRTGTFKSVTGTDSHWHIVYKSDGTVMLMFIDGTLMRVF
jgi:hypothetical protein